MKAAEIMTKTVISVTPETKVAEAARLMLQHRVSGLPVVGPHGSVVGIVTEGDLLRRAETGTERRHARWLEFLISPGRLADEYAHAHGRKVGEVMTAAVVAVGPDQTVTEIIELMERRHIKRVPVIDAGQLVGIVSRANLVRALLHNLPRSIAKASATDETIREEILGEIARQPWGPRSSVDVRVENGVVELFGSIIDDRERAALQVLAENVAGVKQVHDKLVWVEPLSGFVIPASGSEPQPPER